MLTNLLIALAITLAPLALLLNFDRFFTLAERGLNLALRLARKLRLFADIATRSYRRCHRMPYYS